MTDILQTIETPMEVNVWDLVSQVIESRHDSLDLVREHLSNMCANEVAAKNVWITFYSDPDYGPSFVFRDDGIGLDRTGDMAHPGRLDRFLAVAYSGHAGLTADEFGHKGLGSKLSLNCRRLEIKTHSRTSKESYFVFVDDPLTELRAGKRPSFKVVPGAGLRDPGTEVKVLGYEKESGRATYDFDQIKRYVFFSSVIGHTRARSMPAITLKVNENQERLVSGFQYLTRPAESDWKTYVLPNPIERAGEANSEQVRVLLKGGFTLETGNSALTGPFTLTPRTSGLFLSIKGIPYIQLDLNSFRGNFSTLQYKFCRFVVECDALFDQMDFARLSYQPGPTARLFETLLKECFNELAERPEWKTFLRERDRQQQVKKRESLDERKKALSLPTQKFVFLKSNGKLLHREPTNEHDTLALLWKLEGANAIPLPYFETLEHTSIEGIDVIANLRLRPDGDTQQMVPLEIEDAYEEFFEHGHNPNQTGGIICWTIEDPDAPNLEQSDMPYLLFYNSADRKIPVLIMSRFNTIEVKVRPEH